MTSRPLTPEAFARSCRIARPTTHLHGYASRDLGVMVEALAAAVAALREVAAPHMRHSGLCVVHDAGVLRDLGDACACGDDVKAARRALALLDAPGGWTGRG